MGDTLKKEIMPGVHLVVNSVDILSDSQTSKIVTDVQKNFVKTYFSNKKVSDIKANLADMASDSVITPQEKLTLSNKISELAVDHTVLISEAAAESVLDSQEYSDYNTAYNILLGYVNPILATPANSNKIDPELYLSIWEDYWDTRSSLSAAIDDAILATVVTKEEAYNGYDLTIDEEVIATTIPDIPDIVGASSKRNIYLSWPRQKNLTGQSITYEIQCAEIPFASSDVALGYSIGSGGDDPDDWQGAAGAVTIINVNSILINNFPLAQGETGPALKQYYFRVRCRQSANNISDWGECSVNVSTITQADLSSDTVTKQIQALQNKVTVGANGFLGANYDLNDQTHVFTTADQRIYIDADEMTIQKVSSVDESNVPTWSDVMKIGGTARAIVMKELGQRIGMDLDGSDEHSIAFGKDRADYSSYPLKTPDQKFLSLCSDGAIGFSNPDTNKLVGYANPRDQKLHWNGAIHAGSFNYGIAFPLPEKSIYGSPLYPGYGYIDSGIKACGPINGCKEEYIGARASKSMLSADGVYAGKNYYKYNNQASNQLMSTGLESTIDNSANGANASAYGYFTIQKISYRNSYTLNWTMNIYGGAINHSGTGFSTSRDVGMRIEFSFDETGARIKSSLLLKCEAISPTSSTSLKEFTIPASEKLTEILSTPLPDGIYRIFMGLSFVSRTVGHNKLSTKYSTVDGELIDLFSAYATEFELQYAFYIIDQNGTVYGSPNVITHSIPTTMEFNPLTGYCYLDPKWRVTEDITSFISSVTAYNYIQITGAPNFLYTYLINGFATTRAGAIDSPGNASELLRDLPKTPFNFLAPGDFKEEYFSSVGANDIAFIPEIGNKIALGTMDTSSVVAIGSAGPTGAKGEKGDQGEKGEAGSIIPSVLTDKMKGIIIPLYMYPSSIPSSGVVDNQSWITIVEDIKEQDCPIIAIIYPDYYKDYQGSQGGGMRITDEDLITDFTRAIKLLKSAGIIVAGYIYTKYTAWDYSQVQGMVDNWCNLYDIDGIFIDGFWNMVEPGSGWYGSTVNDPLGYYTMLSNYIKAKGKIVIVNPGTAIEQEYIDSDIADIYMVFENRDYPSINDMTAGLGGLWYDPIYMPKHKISRIVHSQHFNKSSLYSLIKYTGWIYCTDKMWFQGNQKIGIRKKSNSSTTVFDFSTMGDYQTFATTFGIQTVLWGITDTINYTNNSTTEYVFDYGYDFSLNPKQFNLNLNGTYAGGYGVSLNKNCLNIQEIADHISDRITASVGSSSEVEAYVIPWIDPWDQGIPSYMPELLKIVSHGKAVYEFLNP